MKKIFVLIIALISCSAYTQITEQKYRDTLEVELKKYTFSEDKKRTISNQLLHENLTTAFNNIVFSSEDLVKNSSSFGFTTEDGETSVSTSLNFKLKDFGRYQLYGISSIQATGAESVFQVFNADAWQNNIGGAIGLALKLPGAAYIDKDYDLNTYKNDSIKRINFLLQPLEKDSTFYVERIKKIQGMLDTLTLLELSDLSILEISSPELKNNIDLIGMQQTKSILKAEKKEKKSYLELRIIPENEIYVKSAEEEKKAAKKKYSKLEKYILNRITDFDKLHDPTYGYRFNWISLNVGVSNGSYKFSTDQIDSSARSAFYEAFDISDTYNHINVNYNLGYHYTANNKKTLRYLNLGTSIYQGSVLDHPLKDGNIQIVKNDLIFQDEDEERFGSLNELESTSIFYGSLNFYGAIFFAADKTFGLNLSYKHYYKIGSFPVNHTLANHFTLLAGPVFRKVNKKDKTSIAFGLDAGFESAEYDKDFLDDFTLRVRIGIPFRVFENK